jgi:hypothetical protein
VLDLSKNEVEMGVLLRSCGTMEMSRRIDKVAQFMTFNADEVLQLVQKLRADGSDMRAINKWKALRSRPRLMRPDKAKSKLTSCS